MFNSPFFTAEFFWVHLGIVFFMGTIFGSFFNVCIYRLPLGESIIFPNSHCFSCGAKIKWYDNIPLFSYLILRGRCRSCGGRFSFRYFFVELLAGVLFAWVFYRFGYSFLTPVYLAFAGMMVVGTFTDIDHWIIPDSVSLGGVAFALGAALISDVAGDGLIVSKAGPFAGDMFLNTFLNSVVGAITGFVLLLVIGTLGSIVFRKEAMGGGDLKLLAFIGAVVGWFNCILVLIIASLLGSIIGIAILVSARFSKRTYPSYVESGESDEPGESENESLREEKVMLRIVKKKAGKEPTAYHHVPFGPYLAIAAMAVVLYHREILNLLMRLFFFESYTFY